MGIDTIIVDSKTTDGMYCLYFYDNSYSPTAVGYIKDGKQVKSTTDVSEWSEDFGEVLVLNDARGEVIYDKEQGSEPNSGEWRIL